MAEIYSWALNDNGNDELYIKSSPVHNKGLYTCKNLPKDTILFRLPSNSEYVSKQHILEALNLIHFDPITRHPDDILKYINHSCSPNAILTANGHLISKTYILSGSEIFIDYSVHITTHGWQMNCFCGEDKCKGIIKNEIYSEDSVTPQKLKISA